MHLLRQFIRESLNNSARLFHVTPVENVASILKTGLRPTSREAQGPSWAKYTYKDRIHMVKTADDAMDIRMLLAIERDENDLEDVELIVLQIDMSKCQNDTPLLQDPDYPNGVYTTSPIPPEAISVISDEELEGDLSF